MICYCLLLVLVTLLATLSCAQTWKKVEKGASDRAREFFETLTTATAKVFLCRVALLRE